VSPKFEMSKDRLTKQQLKTDQLEHALVDARDYVATHKSQTLRWALVGAVALAVVLAIWGGLTLRNRRLGARLSSALAILDAPLAADGAPAVSGQKVYKDAAERLAAAKVELRALAKDAPGSKPGAAATLMLLSLDGPSTLSGANLDAIKSFARAESGLVTGGIAAASLLDVQAAAGRTNEAIETAKKYLDAADAPLPKDVLIFTLGRLYEKTGQNAEAKSYYQRIVTDYPDSPMRFDAQQKTQSL
jgi:tetratricopeptide (TPR) repeat protein